MDAPEGPENALESLTNHRKIYPRICAVYLKKYLKSDMKMAMTFKVNVGDIHSTTLESRFSEDAEVEKFNLRKDVKIQNQNAGNVEERVKCVSKALDIISRNKSELSSHADN